MCLLLLLVEFLPEAFELLVGTLRFFHPHLMAKPSVVFISYIDILNTI